jgi:hypothetical protein
LAITFDQPPLSKTSDKTFDPNFKIKEDEIPPVNYVLRPEVSFKTEANYCSNRIQIISTVDDDEKMFPCQKLKLKQKQSIILDSEDSDFEGSCQHAYSIQYLH